MTGYQSVFEHFLADPDRDARPSNVIGMPSIAHPIENLTTFHKPRIIFSIYLIQRRQRVSLNASGRIGFHMSPNAREGRDDDRTVAYCFDGHGRRAVRSFSFCLG